MSDSKGPVDRGALLSLTLTAIRDVLILENRLLAVAGWTHDLTLGEAAGILFRPRDNADAGASRATHGNSRNLYLARAVAPIARDEVHGDLSRSVAGCAFRRVLAYGRELLSAPFHECFCVAAAIAFGAWIRRRAEPSFSTAVWAKCRHDRNLRGKSVCLSVVRLSAPGRAQA